MSSTASRHPSAAASDTRRRLTPNLFGTAFGLCGLAECWSLAHDTIGCAAWVQDVLWAAAAVTYAVTLVAYLTNVVAGGRARTELTDPTYAPFTALAVIIPMLLAQGWAQHQPHAGRVLFLVSLVLTVALGSWLTAQWITSDLRLAQWHPGYFLPTVAGGLIASGGAAAFGYGSLARLMFGYGTICWLVLGSILLLRLFTEPALPPPLLPTIAIEVAPPVVGLDAWFEINGARPDTVALALSGYAILMAAVQLRLAPLFRRAPFGPGWWSFSFSYAAVFLVAIQWLAIEDVAHLRLLTSVLLAMVTVAMTALAVRTVAHLRRGTYLPRNATPASAVVAAAPSATAGQAPELAPSQR